MRQQQVQVWWPAPEVFKMPSEAGWRFHPIGLFNFGMNLTRLEWAIQTLDVIPGGQGPYLAPFMRPFCLFEHVISFKDIGSEAVKWYDFLNTPKQDVLPDAIKIQLRRIVDRWAVLATERLQQLWLLTPTTRIQPTKLMNGIVEFLEPSEQAFIDDRERSGLSEVCRCILCDSYTAAEFMALRTAESLLRRWHGWKTGKPIEHSGWGQVFDHLAKEYPLGDPKNPPPPELASFGYLKLRRDRLGHPEELSTLTQAEATLLMVCALVKALQQVMSASKPASQSGQDSNAP